MEKIFMLWACIISSQAFSLDEYQFCQTWVDSVRELSVLPVDALIGFKISVAKVSSLDEFGKLKNQSFTDMSLLLQKQKSITAEDADQQILSFLKPMEIQKLSLSIEFNKVTDERIWNRLFDKCVFDNQ